jgi:hypothetical protein
MYSIKEKIRFIVDNNECGLVAVSVTCIHPHSVNNDMSSWFDMLSHWVTPGWLSATANKLNCSKWFWRYNLATIQLIFNQTRPKALFSKNYNLGWFRLYCQNQIIWFQIILGLFSDCYCGTQPPMCDHMWHHIMSITGWAHSSLRGHTHHHKATLTIHNNKFNKFMIFIY